MKAERNERNPHLDYKVYQQHIRPLTTAEPPACA